MKCKYCDAELTAEELFCPVCGKEQAPAEEAAPKTVTEQQPVVPQTGKVTSDSGAWKVIAIVACCGMVVLLAVLLAVLIKMGTRDTLPETTGTVPATTTAPVVQYDSYHGEPAQVLEAADTVVAVIGEHQLTNRQLQTIYWVEFYNFVENYGSYLSSMGLDYTQPLNTQGIPNGDQSWEQYFVELALNSWHRYLVLGLEAQKAGMELTEENRKNLDEFPAALEENAGAYGYASAEEMIAADFGEGITVEDYLWYLELQYLGQQYYNQIYDAEQPTREEVSAYFDEHADDYLSYGITKESGKLLDVRHILIQPEGAQTDATTGYVTATDEQWEACRAAAQAILDGWAAGEATEESFAALVSEHSVDPGSAETGGLYTNVMKGQMVEAFDTWMFAEGRQTGDTGLVKTEFGYHIMYFVGGEEGWYVAGRPDLVQSRAQAILDGLREATPMESFEDKIVLDSAVLGVYKETQDSAEDAAS